MRQTDAGRLARVVRQHDAGLRELRRPLTTRELEVLELLAAGLTGRAIAERLVLSPKTVGTHTERIFRKLGVHSREHALEVAYRNELLVKAADPLASEAAE